MTLFRFILSSARHYWRAHLGLLLGAFLASAILSGSLFVGDSVRFSLRRLAEQRLGSIKTGLLGGDRWFTQKLADSTHTTPLIIALGSAANSSSKARVNGTQILGVEERFWKLSPSQKSFLIPKGKTLINQSLAKKLQLKVGDVLLLRLERPSAISRDAPLSGSTQEDVSLRREVAGILDPEDFGNFQLTASQTTPDTAWIGLDDLQTQLEMDAQVNALLSHEEKLDETTFDRAKSLEDLGLQLTRISQPAAEWEVTTRRVFLDPIVASQLLKSPGSYGVLTYLVNGLKSAQAATPYSMVTAVSSLPGVESSAAPIHLEEKETAITQWLADDQKLKIGDSLRLSYFIVGIGRELKEQSAEFRVKHIYPMAHPVVTKAWTPEFPGVSDVDNCRDWEPGIPMDMKAIRDQDEKYWDDYKGTPKAFISLTEGQRLWENRFGAHTSVRLPASSFDESGLKQFLLGKLTFHHIGLRPQNFHTQAQAAARGSVDFGGLFIGLSFFLILAALFFAALLFLFTLERRASQVGLLLAVGWLPAQVKKTWLGEAGLIALLGTLLGLVGGTLYTKLALHGLRGAWSGAAQGLTLYDHAQPSTVLIAGFSTLLVLLLTLHWAGRRLFRQTPRQLWSESPLAVDADLAPQKATFFRRHLPWFFLFAALVLLAIGPSMKAPEAVAGVFFGSGLFLLIACLITAGRLLRREPRHQAKNLAHIALRNLSRRPSRSLTVIGMMAGGIFLVTAVNSFRMSAGDPYLPTSGTGGFQLIGESSLPIYEDLNTPAGWDAYGLDEALMKNVRIIPFRVRSGDDASCLNLNRAQKPVLVGVSPHPLKGRFRLASGTGWEALEDPKKAHALADQATAMWGLGKGVGDAVPYPTAQGSEQPFTLLGLLAGSVLQGKVITSESAFLQAYPDAAGYRFFLIQTPKNQESEVSAHLTRQLEQRGLALEPAVQRLNAFLAVQNTYIGIFTLLGGLGVLLGTAGLGVLISRHVLERRGELGLMQAVGFSRSALHSLILLEHAVLLAAGLLVGLFCALLAVFPALRQSSQDLPWSLLGQLIVGILIFGLWICSLATKVALRGKLFDSLRRE